MKEVTLKLNVQELQTVLQALGNLPYIQVEELIGNLQMQATPQLQSMNGTSRSEDTTAEKKEVKKPEKVA